MVLQLGDFEPCLLFMLEFCFIYYEGGVIADQLMFKEIESAYKAGN